jgi:hypothetical protein
MFVRWQPGQGYPQAAMREVLIRLHHPELADLPDARDVEAPSMSRAKSAFGIK